jgi:hypothetical protein
LARSSTPRPGRFRAPLSGQKKALSTRTRPNDQHRASGRKMPALSAVSLNYRRARSFTRRPGHAGGHGRFLPPRGGADRKPCRRANAGAGGPAPGMAQKAALRPRNQALGARSGRPSLRPGRRLHFLDKPAGEPKPP